MVACNLNPSIRSHLLNYKQFILQINISEFLKEPDSVKCCCNKYSNNFVKNYYGHTITGDFNIVTNEKTGELIFKGSKYRES